MTLDHRRVVATIEARTRSTRLPAKVLAMVEGQPLLQWVIERARAAASVDYVVVATTDLPVDDPIESLAVRTGVGCFRGSESDVMGRVLSSARAARADDVVALTGDNPLIDPCLIDDVIEFYRAGGFDYVSTTHMHHSLNWRAERTFPVGVSVQVFPVGVLADAAARTENPVERSHASFAIYKCPERYRLGAFLAAGKYAEWRHPELRLTVDTTEDLELMRELFRALYHKGKQFSTLEAIKLIVADERLQRMNRHIPQNLVHQELATFRRSPTGE